MERLRNTITPLLGKLLPLLENNQDAAARAIGRILQRAGHGWHDLTSALLSPPAQSEPNTGEPAGEHSIIWFPFHHRDQFSSDDAQFVESLTRWRTPLSDNKQRIGLLVGSVDISPSRAAVASNLDVPSLIQLAYRRRARGFSSSKMPGTRASGGYK
jgi:hypothetical protein